MSNDVPPTETATADQHHSALFATLVMQQTNMAMIFLGQTPHPETGKATTDTDAASMFIDTLEMLAAKTKGNLSKREHDLLQQHLTMVRMAFVEAVDVAAPSPAASPSTPPPADPATTPPDAALAGEAPTDDPRKKFVKKY